MQFRLYKLQFTAPCHFGDGETSADLAGSGTTCFSDTLVSALFLEYLALYGEEIAKQFINALQNGLLRFSDLFPYIGDSDTLFLPRPQLISQKRIDRTEFPIEEIKRGMQVAKKVKRVEYIPEYLYTQYIERIQAGQVSAFFKEDASLEELTVPIAKQAYTRVAIQRDSDSLPYQVGTVTFQAGAGLYFILGYEEASLLVQLDQVLQSLSYTGIGGKRSSGYGQFTYIVEELTADSDYESLYEMLMAKEANMYISLSLCVPQREDIPFMQEGAYKLIGRGGFVYSQTYADTLHKRNRYFAVKSGSTFARPLQGRVLVIEGGQHPVYRYGKGLFLGVSI